MINKKNLNNLINSFNERYGITSDKDLINLAKKLKIKLNYIGFIENLKSISEDGGYIINLSNPNTSGSHWTSFYKKNDEIFYYDSFAVGFEDKLLNLAKKANVKIIIWNDYFQMQNISEDLCGIWCILFLYYMQHSKQKKLIDRFFEFTKNYEDLNGDYAAGIAFK